MAFTVLGHVIATYSPKDKLRHLTFQNGAPYMIYLPHIVGTY